MNKTNEIKRIFGQNLKKFREDKNLSQEELAVALGLETYQTINRIENGKSFVSAGLYEKICQFFNEEPHVFFLKPKQKFTLETINRLEAIDIKINKIYEILKKRSG